MPTVNSKDGLTEKQRLFCIEYVVCLNATEATKKAGYKCKSDSVAKSVGCENLTKPNVIRKIKQLKAEISKKHELTRDYIISNLKEIAETEKLFNPAVARLAFSDLGRIIGIFAEDNAQKQPQTANIAFIDGTKTAEEIELRLIENMKKLGTAECYG